MEWPATLLGSIPAQDVVVDSVESRPDLYDAAHTAVRELKKSKREESTPMMLSVSPEALRGEPVARSGQTLYQPIGKIVYAGAITTGGALKKSYHFCFIASEEGSRAGDTNAKYKWYDGHN